MHEPAAWRRPATDGAERAVTVVFVHGAMDRAASFQRVARRLPEATVTTYDRRGYNESLELPATGDITRHAADLAGVIGDGPSVVIGHSFGALIGLVTAQHYRDLILSLGCYEPPGRWLTWWSSEERGRPSDDADTAEWFMRRTIGDAAWDRLGPEVQGLRRREGPALVGDLDAVDTRCPYAADEILVPTLFAYGAASPGHFRRSATEQAAELPEADVVELSGAAHGAHLSHPGAFAAFARRVIEIGSSAPAA